MTICLRRLRSRRTLLRVGLSQGRVGQGGRRIIGGWKRDETSRETSESNKEGEQRSSTTSFFRRRFPPHSRPAAATCHRIVAATAATVGGGLHSCITRRTPRPPTSRTLLLRFLAPLSLLSPVYGPTERCTRGRAEASARANVASANQP